MTTLFAAPADPQLVALAAMLALPVALTVTVAFLSAPARPQKTVQPKGFLKGKADVTVFGMK